MAITPGMKDITQGIISSCDARMAWEAERKGASAELKKELDRGVTERKSGVKGILKDFQSAHKEMSTQLKKALAQGEAERKKTSAELKKELADYVRGIRNEVAGIRRATKADLKEARTTWQELTSTMQAKRAGVKMPPKVEVKAEVPVAEKVEAPVAEEVAAAPVVEEEIVEEEIPDLEAKLLAMITLHPEGITLTEVAEKLDVAPIVLGRASRSLIKKGKIRKEDKLYFPLGTE